MLGAARDRSWDGSWATPTRHKRMLERFQNGFEHPKLSMIEFLLIFGPFWSLVGSLSCCFFRVFCRFFHGTFICSLDLSVTRFLRRMLISVAYIQTPPSVKIISCFFIC